jgi:hypothetical protein
MGRIGLCQDLLGCIFVSLSLKDLVFIEVFPLLRLGTKGNTVAGY